MVHTVCWVVQKLAAVFPVLQVTMQVYTQQTSPIDWESAALLCDCFEKGCCLKV